MRKFFTLLILLAYTCSPSAFVWGQNTSAEQLFSLQKQARHYASQSEHSRDLLFYISATLLWAYMEKLPALQLKMALTQELNQISVSSHSWHTEHSFNQMFAKKAAADPSQLSLFPQEAAPTQPPTPKKEDLSWLDEPQEALRATKKAQENSLFPELEVAKQPKKSYLSRRIEERYGNTNYFRKLSQEEIEGLFQRLNQAAAINYKSGKEAAQKFLADMANKYPKAQVLFLQARHLLLGGALLLLVDQLVDFSSENQSLYRLVRNPELFLEATREDLALLAEHPQSVEYANLLVLSLQEMASSSLSDEELAYIQSVNQQTRQSQQNKPLRYTIGY